MLGPGPVTTPLAAAMLVALFGVGADSAGALLVAAGDNPERLRIVVARLRQDHKSQRYLRRMNEQVQEGSHPQRCRPASGS